jgi:hypothetical protein
MLAKTAKYRQAETAAAAQSRKSQCLGKERLRIVYQRFSITNLIKTFRGGQTGQAATLAPKSRLRVASSLWKPGATTR